MLALLYKGFQMFTPERKKEIADILMSKVKSLNCPMCKNQTFTMMDDYFNKILQSDFNGLTIGGRTVPSIGIVCNNCGFISEHALGVLGLLPKSESVNESKTTDNVGTK